MPIIKVKRGYKVRSYRTGKLHKRTYKSIKTATKAAGTPGLGYRKKMNGWYSDPYRYKDGERPGLGYKKYRPGLGYKKKPLYGRRISKRIVKKTR